MRRGPPEKRARPARRGLAAGVLGAVLVAVSAAGQITTPLQIGAQDQIKDEFGVVLRGSAYSSPADRDLVQVLWASNSMIYPPAYDGTPDPANAPVDSGTWWMGSLTSPELVHPGIFSAAIASPRPAHNSKLFVRVFNAAKAKSATFYGDSELLTVRNNNVLIVHIGATTNAVDPRDFDNDGLNNSWERSLGANLYNPDSDGDGMKDGDEFRAGTGILDPNSLFVMAWIEPAGAGAVRVEWESIPGKSYQVEYCDQPMSNDAVFSNVSAVVTAVDVVTGVVIPSGLENNCGSYRVRLAE